MANQKPSMLLTLVILVFLPVLNLTSSTSLTEDDIKFLSENTDADDTGKWSDQPLGSKTDFWTGLLSHAGLSAAKLQGPGLDALEVPATLHVLLGQSLGHGIRNDFLSVAMGSTIFAEKARWASFNTSSTKLKNMASALRPCGFRIGGTAADFLQFDPNANENNLPETSGWNDKYDSGYFNASEFQWNGKNFTMAGSQWDTMAKFAIDTGLQILFDVNLFRWASDGTWDPSNAALFLSYSQNRSIPLAGFELGNEPNAYHINFNLTIPGAELVTDMLKLKNLLQTFPMYSNSPIVGPDVTSLARHPGAVTYLADFLSAGAYKAISDIGLHQYYLDGRTASAADFLNPEVLDQMKTELAVARALNQKYPPMLGIRMTETSSCYGGGAPGLSDRYVAGFLWLDKLGICAQAGVQNVYRQTFFGGNYALITDDMLPLPDYFLSVLYKRLVEGPVISISVAPQSENLRIYANCASSSYYGYPPGAIVIYYLNLGQNGTFLTLNQFPFQQLELFQLTPGDLNGLTSEFVSLNGQKLEMIGSDLPQMNPMYHVGDVFTDGQTFGFIVVPNANVSACL